jgi:hypothetical protein
VAGDIAGRGETWMGEPLMSSPFRLNAAKIACSRWCKAAVRPALTDFLCSSSARANCTMSSRTVAWPRSSSSGVGLFMVWAEFIPRAKFLEGVNVFTPRGELSRPLLSQHGVIVNLRVARVDD